MSKKDDKIVIDSGLSVLVENMSNILMSESLDFDNFEYVINKLQKCVDSYYEYIRCEYFAK